MSGKEAEETRAIQRLNDAAPDMFEALKKLRGILSAGLFNCTAEDIVYAIQSADAALLKAGYDGDEQ